MEPLPGDYGYEATYCNYCKAVHMTYAQAERHLRVMHPDVLAPEREV